jgi:2-polyprenyl-6-methoxyphenol hydroxylase-like FAD-dependent oxidoreductase
MFTALRLAESGIGVLLIDKESCTAGRSYACALHPRTLQLLDKVGVARDAIKPASGSELTLLLRQLGLEFEFANLQEVGA